MNSVDPGKNVEVRHFMDDEHQLSIGVDKDIWPALQAIANQQTKGSDWYNLNIWIIRRLITCPGNIEPHQWISQAIE